MNGSLGIGLKDCGEAACRLRKGEPWVRSDGGQSTGQPNRKQRIGGAGPI
jgi:hypothetical protein